MLVFKTLILLILVYLLADGLGVGVMKTVTVGAGFGINESRGSCLGAETTTATTPIPCVPAIRTPILNVGYSLIRQSNYLR